MSGAAAVLRAPVIAGNWKMYKGPEATRAFFGEFLRTHESDGSRSVLFFPAAISLPAAVEAIGSRSEIAIGVQNIHWEKEGAFTGEISAGMAREAGASFALVGHSERRHIFGESDDDVRRKVAAALGAGLGVIACVGETLEERRAGRLEEVVLRQLEAALDGVPGGAHPPLAIAYEPVWAIGTGETATPEDAASAHAVLRRCLSVRLEGAQGVPILYGGSVKPANAAELLSAPGVDGVLVGGASLDPAGFAEIAAAGR